MAIDAAQFKDNIKIQQLCDINGAQFNYSIFKFKYRVSRYSNCAALMVI